MYERGLNGIPRTNYTCEAWNNRFSTMLGKSHPNLHVFLSALQKEEVYAESRRRDIDLGEGPVRKRRKYAQNNTRIEIREDRSEI